MRCCYGVLDNALQTCCSPHPLCSLLQKRGVNLHPGCHPTRIEPATDGGYMLHYTDRDGKEQSLKGAPLLQGWMCCLC